MRETISNKFLWNFQIFNNIREIVVEGICYLHIIRYNFLIFYQSYYYPWFIFLREKMFWQFAKISCYQSYSFRLGLQNIPFSFFLEVIHKSLFVLCRLIYLQQLDFSRRCFLKRILSIMDLDNALVMKSLLFPWRYFFFLEHDAQVHSGIIQKIIADF